MSDVSQIKNATSPAVILPHYAFAALSFLALTILMLLSPEAFSGHYFHPRLLTITHLAALGWGCMIIFGALYQMLPVILDTKLYSETLAKVTFAFFATGIAGLTYAFWNFYVGIHLQVSSILLLCALLLFSFNIFITAAKTPSWTIQADFILTSSLWLLLTGILGTLMAFNFVYPFLRPSHLLFLKIHAHTGMAGWFLLLIMGAASRLLPMFLLSPSGNSKKLSAAYYLINAGLVCFCTDLFFRNNRAFTELYAIAIAAGIIFFILHIRSVFRNRLRKQLDTGLRHSAVSFLLLLLPLLLGIIIAFIPEAGSGFLLQVYLVYGITTFLGFITSLILGQTFKTLPFIVWMHRYRHSASAPGTPLPRQLYSEKLARAQYVTYLAAILTLAAGVLLSLPVMIESGALLFLVTAVLYNINVFKVLFHSPARDVRTPS